ncbi:S8 family serine peptidase [Bacteroidales bacterium OttesenSCG-928-I21]|nr:S8 family serine peptidase [Bacteroidales bacterium OttesenSCG-928-I21]
MKKFLLSLLLFLAGFSMSLSSQTIFPSYIDGHLYFKFVDSYEVDFKVNEDVSVDYDQLPNLHYLFDEFGVTLITRPLFIFDDPQMERIIRLEFEDAQNIELFIKKLEQNPDIEYAEKIPFVKKCVTYNDPYYTTSGGFNFKWHLEKINAPAAWGLQTGSSTIKVAIVDNAVWGAHPDLNILTTNQCNVGNGTTVTGNSAPPTSISQTTSCTANTLNYGTCYSYNWSHGTHCAGLVGAINNNGVGISSIGGGVTVMGIRAANDNDVMYYTSTGVQWAINNGAKVVSMSYGSEGQTTSERNFFQTAANNGVIFVAAAGNEGDEGNEIIYPAGYPSVISVASIDDDGNLSYFSQYGPGRADIAAPGGFNSSGLNILSTTYCTSQFYRLSGLSTFNNQYYDGMQGTSMACPIVAGLVGLMASAYPNITLEQAKSCLQSTATALSSGSNPIDGNGYINAYEAVQCAQNLNSGFTLAVTPSSLSFISTGGAQSVTVTSNTTWTVSESCSWITISPTSGTNNGSFSVTAAANTGASRTCTITVSGAGVTSQTITVSQSGATSGGDEDCSWLTNITQTDVDNLNEIGGAYVWEQDRRNDIYKYAERFENTISGTIDSIEVYIYEAISNSPSTSSITFKIYNESAQLPGTALGSKTVRYNSFTENSINSIKFDSPISVTGNFYVAIELNSSPTTDTLRFISSGNLGRTAINNTTYCNHENTWYRTGNLFLNDHFYSLYFWAKVCPQTSSTLTVNPSTLSYTAAGSTQTVAITSNTSWAVSENCNWITVSPISGTNNGSFSVTAEANTGASRTCTITVSGTGVASKTITVTQQGYVGITTEDIENSLTIYPNPTSDYVNIKSDFNISKLQIVDILGKMVFEQTNLNEKFLNLPVSNLPDSMYIIIIYSEDGKSYHKKLTKK